MESKEVDKNLYSRQIAAFGAETMGKLVQMRVFLQGLRGVGIQTAKNLILAGPASVILHDDEKVGINDLGTNFYCDPSHVGKVSRAEASLPQLSELNGYVKTGIHKGPITVETLKDFDIVVFTDFFDREQLIQFNNFCHENNKGFIVAGELGLYGFTFVDFGSKHVIFDATGEESQNFVIAGISNEEQGLVTVHEDKRHNFQDGDYVTFQEVQGMEEINDKKFKIKFKSPYQFTIGDTRSFKPYTRQGIVQHVKVPKELAFRTFKETLTHPLGENQTELALLDFSKFFRSELLHLGYLAILEFYHEYKRLPAVNNEDEANKVVEFAQNFNKQFTEKQNQGMISVEAVDEEIIRNIARFAVSNISPIASFWGGIVAQEIVKYTGKFTPIHQWLHNEFFQALPSEKVDRTPANSRYDDQIVIFGRDFQSLLHKQQSFMIGAGALGCEFLKMFALMGLGTNGMLTVADDDNIEVSNLNRQFLFRKENVGQSKAQCASARVTKMNPDFKSRAFKSRVDPDNEPVFNDDFWEGLSLVINAVDNVKARMYVDSKCLWYNKPLFESGTLGTKCNSQVILPHLTASYSESVDPPQESIPLCTLKNFPYQIDHCIQWARDYFEGMFVEGPGDLAQFVEDPAKFLQKVQTQLKQQTAILQSKLERLNTILQAYSKGNYEACVQLARYIFFDVHTDQIAQLLFCFPLDHQNQQGTLFWSGPKRPPQVIEYSSQDNSHAQYIQAVANIFAYIFGLPYEANLEKVQAIADQFHYEPPRPQNLQIQTDEKEPEAPAPSAGDDEKEIQRIAQRLLSVKFSGAQKVTPIEFEKDDPTNWHIEAVSGISNLRARNYRIKEIDKFQVKVIAGKIIPALATTTAMVVGAVGVEILKYLQTKKLEQYRNCFINLAIPVFVFSEPQEPRQAKDKPYDPIEMSEIKAIPPGHTLWNHLLIRGPITIAQFLEHFKVTYQVNVSMIMYRSTPIYLPFMDQEKAKERLHWDLIKVLEANLKEPLPAYKKNIDLTVNGEMLENSEMSPHFPIIKYVFQN